MTRAHVLRTFRKAGFPMIRIGEKRYRYISSVVIIRYQESWFSDGKPTLTVCHGKRGASEFESPAKALAFIQSILSIQLVGGNDWALNTGPRGELRLVGGAA